MSLLRKDQQFKLTSAAQEAFDKLKSLFSSTPILRHFDPELPVTLHADSSGFAVSEIISQPHENRLHFVTFWSCKCTPTECNYNTHDREMLAIIESMKYWRHYLEGSKHSIRVRSDHKNLKAFMTTKLLNRRQARWAEVLSGYDFVLNHISSSKNPADGPSQRPDYSKGVDVPSGSLIPRSALHLIPQHLLPPGVWPTPRESEFAEPDPQSLLTTFTPESPLRQKILDTLVNDPIADEQRRDPKSPFLWENGLLLYNYCIYVPENDRSDRLNVSLIRVAD